MACLAVCAWPCDAVQSSSGIIGTQPNQETEFVAPSPPTPTNQTMPPTQMLLQQQQLQQPWPPGASSSLKPRRLLLQLRPPQCPTAAATQPHRLLLLRPPRARAAAANTSSVRLTVSDAELSARGFTVRRSAEGIDVAALNEVFARVGFPRRQEDRLRRALTHSTVVWLSASSGPPGEVAGRPVAFARAAGDGVFNAVVWDVVVEPSCQGLGLGRAVMERLVGDLRADGVANIVLYAETRVVGFYKLLDFALDPDGIRGMAYYRKSAFATAANTANTPAP